MVRNDELRPILREASGPRGRQLLSFATEPILVQLPTWRINLAIVAFNDAAFHLSLFDMFDVDCEQSIAASAPTRQSTFLAGRLAAKAALLSLGASSSIVRQGGKGEPVWPSGTTGSITHTGKIAICGVAQLTSISSMGVDLENVLNETILCEIQDIFLDREEQMLVKHLMLPTDIAYTTVFSAKESLFKALFSFVQDYFDFGAVKLEAFEIAHNQLKFRIVDPGIVRASGRDLVSVKFDHLDARSVLTICVIENVA